MKMPDEVYNALVRDMNLVKDEWAKRNGQPSKESLVDVWRIFHEVMLQRNSDDSHPVFIERIRVVTQDTTEYRVGGSAYDLFYTKHGLNDDHICTALRKYAKEYLY